ncbi:MAG: hypothetical protein NTU70_11620 [Methylococcales bacterium]|nr:hypothetical protein [Methylococcales bacterium]
MHDWHRLRRFGNLSVEATWRITTAPTQRFLLAPICPQHPSLCNASLSDNCGVVAASSPLNGRHNDHPEYYKIL